MTDKRKRAAPTIDLKATEVPEPSSAKAESAPAENVAAPPREPPKQKAKAETQPPLKQPPVAEPHPQPTGFPIKTYVVPITAGFAGAILGGAVIWALLSGSSNDSAQIAALQKQVHDLQNRPAPAADSQALNALRERLSKIEHDIANLPPGDKTFAERLTAADSALKSVGIALAAINKRNDDAAANAKQAEDRAAAAEKAVGDLRDSVQSAKQQAFAAADADQLAAVQQRVISLEQSVKDVRAQLAQAKTGDVAARLALSAAALRDAVESGAPYQAELAQAKALSADSSALTPLALFAAKGIPSQQALASELNELMPALIKATSVQDAPGGFIERLQANARKLVRISPIDAHAGNQPSDVLARIEVAARRADIDGALADIGKLPEKARQQAGNWITVAVARQKTLTVARRFASDSARSLQP